MSMNIPFATHRWLPVAVVCILLDSGKVQATVAEIKAQPLGSLVGIELVVSSTVDLVNSVNTASFSGQDNTGGISILGNQAAIQGEISSLGLLAGDGVFVLGTTESFNGLFQIRISNPSLDIVPLGAAAVPQ